LTTSTRAVHFDNDRNRPRPVSGMPGNRDSVSSGKNLAQDRSTRLPDPVMSGGQARDRPASAAAARTHAPQYKGVCTQHKENKASQESARVRVAPVHASTYTRTQDGSSGNFDQRDGRLRHSDGGEDETECWWHGDLRSKVRDYESLRGER
jgi:hypothetical protein